MALPAHKDIELYQGDSYELIARFKDIDNNYVDLSGSTVKSQIRVTKQSTTVLAEFTTDILNQTDPATLGAVKLSLTPLQTTGLTSGVWDVQVTWADGTVKTYGSGSVTVSEEVTRV